MTYTHCLPTPDEKREHESLQLAIQKSMFPHLHLREGTFAVRIPQDNALLDRGYVEVTREGVTAPPLEPICLSGLTTESFSPVRVQLPAPYHNSAAQQLVARALHHHLPGCQIASISALGSGYDSDIFLVTLQKGLQGVLKWFGGTRSGGSMSRFANTLDKLHRYREVGIQLSSAVAESPLLGSVRYKQETYPLELRVSVPGKPFRFDKSLWSFSEDFVPGANLSRLLMEPSPANRVVLSLDDLESSIIYPILTTEQKLDHDTLRHEVSAKVFALLQKIAPDFTRCAPLHGANIKFVFEGEGKRRVFLCVVTDYLNQISDAIPP
jgi:hypothetical protein